MERSVIPGWPLRSCRRPRIASAPTGLRSAWSLLPPLPPIGERYRRQLAESDAVVAGEVAGIEESARKRNGDHRRVVVRRLQQAPRVLEPHRLHEGHRRGATGLAESLEDAARAAT